MTHERAQVLVEALQRAVLEGVYEFEGEPERIRVDLGLVPVFLPLPGSRIRFDPWSCLDGGHRCRCRDRCRLPGRVRPPLRLGGPAHVLDVRLLGYEGRVAWAQTVRGLDIDMPEAAATQAAHAFAITTRGAASA